MKRTILTIGITALTAMIFSSCSDKNGSNGNIEDVIANIETSMNDIDKAVDNKDVDDIKKYGKELATYLIQYESLKDSLKKKDDELDDKYDDIEDKCDDLDVDLDEIIDEGFCAAFIEEYETFIDEYINIFKKVKDNPGDMSIVSDYEALMKKADSMQDKASSMQRKCSDEKLLKKLEELNKKILTTITE